MSDETEMQLKVLEEQYEDLQENVDEFIDSLTEMLEHLKKTSQITDSGYSTLIFIIKDFWQEGDALHGK